MFGKSTSPGSGWLWLALPIGITACLIGMIPIFGGKGPAPPTEHECWVASGPGQYKVLDWVENLETCGARLEVLFLRSGMPVSGTYGGIGVFVDTHGIEAAAPNEPRTTLLGPETRRQLDAAIQSLIQRGTG